MNKKVLLIILLFIPFIINAKVCDEAKHKEYEGLASSITYDHKYSKSSGKFDITVYNIFEGMYIKYNGKTIESDGQKVVINDVKQGSDVMIYVYADDGCSEIKIITFIEPYYNEYYGTEICKGYEDKLMICSSQFTEAPVTKEVIEIAKENYGKAIQAPEKEKTEEESHGIITIIKEYIQKWGIKVLLVVLTIFISSSLFSAKFRKIKHGI